MTLIDSHLLDQLTQDRSYASRRADIDGHPRCKLLLDSDQLMLDLYRRGLSQRQLAIVFRMSPGTVSRRLRRVLRVLRNPLIAAVSDPSCKLSAAHRAVALDRYLLRQTIAGIARKRSLPRRQVLWMLEYVRGWNEARKLS
jgi:hypothetical protein